MSSPDEPTVTDNTPTNRADSLDGDVLGEIPGDDRLPGVNDFTDRTILNSEDPAMIMGGSETADNLETRVLREVPDGIEVSQDGGFRLIDVTSGDSVAPTGADDEEELLGDAQRVTEPSAEEAAIRTEKR